MVVLFVVDNERPNYAVYTHTNIELKYHLMEILIVLVLKNLGPCSSTTHQFNQFPSVGIVFPEFINS